MGKHTLIGSCAHLLIAAVFPGGFPSSVKMVLV